MDGITTVAFSRQNDTLVQARVQLVRRPRLVLEKKKKKKGLIAGYPRLRI